jgi:metal-responsive CopG/Arc/MetJ family transcriptional regulator
MVSTLTNEKVVMGICMPRNLQKAINERRGYIPRSKYISLILEQHIHKGQDKNEGYITEDKQSKSRDQPGHRSANSPDLPFTGFLK